MFARGTSWGLRWLLLPVALLALAAQVQVNAQANQASRDANSEKRLAREVNHELLLLPWYSVFDNIQYTVNGTEVTLLGQVVQPTTKSDAEKHVKGIEGVSKVTNNIEVLPLSPQDDRLRRALYRAIYGESSLQKYGMGTVQGIHIIVKNGHATLEGYVLNEGDKNLAGIRAKGVPGVFSVTNNLRISNSNTEMEESKK